MRGSMVARRAYRRCLEIGVFLVVAQQPSSSPVGSLTCASRTGLRSSEAVRSCERYETRFPSVRKPASGSGLGEAYPPWNQASAKR